MRYIGRPVMDTLARLSHRMPEAKLEGILTTGRGLPCQRMALRQNARRPAWPQLYVKRFKRLKSTATKASNVMLHREKENRIEEASTTK